MLGTARVKEFILTIDASSSESLKRGLETVLGTKDGFEFQELTGGTTNRVVHCTYSGGSCVFRWDYSKNKEREFSQNHLQVVGQGSQSNVVSNLLES